MQQRRVQPGTHRAELAPVKPIPAAPALAVLRATEDVENALSALVKREAQVGILNRCESSFAKARDNSFAAYQGGGVSLIDVLDWGSPPPPAATNRSTVVALKSCPYTQLTRFRCVAPEAWRRHP